MSRYSYEERLSIIRHAVHLCTWLLATSFPVVATHFHFIELIIHCTTIVNVGLCKVIIKLIINHNMIEFSLSLLMSVNVFKFLCRYKALFVICILTLLLYWMCACIRSNYGQVWKLCTLYWYYWVRDVLPLSRLAFIDFASGSKRYIVSRQKSHDWRRSTQQITHVLTICNREGRKSNSTHSACAT